MTDQFQAKVNKIYEARETFKKELLDYHSFLKKTKEAKMRNLRVESLVEKCKAVFEKLISKNEALTNIAKSCQVSSYFLTDLEAYLHRITCINDQVIQQARY